MSKKVLFVDDDPISAFLNKKTLLKIDSTLDVKIITDAQEALDYLKEGNPADVIFLDLNMPEMSGIEFLDEYKALSLPGDIIALTSITPRKEKMDRLIRLGCKQVLVKPLTEDKIEEVIAEK